MGFWPRRKPEPEPQPEARSRPKKGDPYVGDVVRVNDKSIVPWPGLYAVDPETRGIRVDTPIEGNRRDGWRHA